ncbi:hypothetical protein EUGRSUZ_E00381 [Eucalyptus grandis]|uniref:Uncharacterized protein n=2 Tax=Eucalyptus grandis TaxID=71139 RepID=A0ACC3KRH3_EUCGR|nr:hypothetical protein EUGRSUZ_E00381 [Eucalyptus grandis]
MERIEHFSHPHWLTKCTIRAYDEEVKCFACMKCCLNQYYSCNLCRFFLHVECAKLQTEFPAHPLHPVHPLTLGPTAYYIGSVYCHACDKRCHGFTFRCEQCDFDLDIDCALKSSNSRVKDQFQHFSHDHPLVLEEVIAHDEEAWCQACDKRCSSNTYTCSLCEFFLHKSCAELKRELQHWRHKEHDLELRTSSSVYDGTAWCNLCWKRVRGFVYHCEICGFDLDLECSLQLPPTLETGVRRQEIDHFSHKHPLTLGEERQDDVVTCAACGDDCSSCQIYSCEECGYFLHESCTKLPQEMKHLDHKEHPLKLQVALYSNCDICKEGIKGFTECTFHLDVACALITEKIHNFSHGHSLKLTKMELNCHKLNLQSSHSKVFCSACKENFHGFTFSCKECKCDYNLHLLCGPLPCLIESDNHKHVLQLEDKFVEDDSGEYYCDACEKKRDPEKCVYKCSQKNCPYVAHFECMKPEVCLVSFIPRYFCHLPKKFMLLCNFEARSMESQSQMLLKFSFRTMFL